MRRVFTGVGVEDSIFWFMTLSHRYTVSNCLKELGAFIVKVLEFGFFFSNALLSFETHGARGVSFLNEWVSNNKSASVQTR